MCAARAEVVATGEPEGVRIIEHTADFGLEVEAPSVEACFARAAAGLFSSFAEAGAGDEPDTKEVVVDVHGESLEELLVLWLDELLYRAEAERLIFTSFEVDTVDDQHLRGRARGRPPTPGETYEPPVKGVTHHDLWVRQEQSAWRAHLIIDV